MPFTFSHPAIVIPLLNRKRKLFSTTGLVIGSLIPDFESFIRFTEHKKYSHTWPGIFWFDLPLALFAAFVFHYVVRDPLIDNLPDVLADKFRKYRKYDWGYYFKTHFWTVMFSMILGITLHLLWDAFTHLNFTNPNATDSDVYIWGVQVFKILQDANSVLGLAAVVWYVAFMPRQVAGEEEVHSKYIYVIKNDENGNYRKIWFWAGVCIIAVVTVLVAMYTLPKVSFVLLIDANISGCLLGLVLMSLIMRNTRY